MPYVIGIVLSLIVALFASRVGFDRDRAFYPTVLIVVALYYVLFAAMTGSVQTVLMESVGMTLFAVLAVIGFKSSAWWPAFCLAYDVGAAGTLTWVIKRRPGGDRMLSRST